MTILDTARELLDWASRETYDATNYSASCEDIPQVCRALIARTEALRELRESLFALRRNVGQPKVTQDEWNRLECAMDAARDALSEPEQQSNTGK